jgi:hypothetical protein
MTEIVRGDLLHLGLAHRPGKPSVGRLRPRQIAAIQAGEHQSVRCLVFALHRQLIEHERRDRHRAGLAALSRANGMPNANLYRVFVDAEPAA